jgi:uncharacterized protein YukE
MSTETLRILIENLFATANHLGQSGRDSNQAQQALERSWARLDAGWDTYAEAEIGDAYNKVMDEISRMTAMFGQMDEALNKTADYIEQVDKSAAELFSASESGAVGLMASLPDTSGMILPPRQGGGDPPPGYLDPDNEGSTSKERVNSLLDFLATTEAGRDESEWLEENGVVVVFGDIEDPSTIAECSLDGKTITLDIDFANLSDYALIATLIHEATHSRLQITEPIVLQEIDPLEDPSGYRREVARVQELILAQEYAAYLAEAEIWGEIREQIPFEQRDPDDLESRDGLIEHYYNLIYNPDGTLRDSDVVIQDLEAIYYP